jgi:hypothetical protein
MTRHLWRLAGLALLGLVILVLACAGSTVAVGVGYGGYGYPAPYPYGGVVIGGPIPIGYGWN